LDLNHRKSRVLQEPRFFLLLLSSSSSLVLSSTRQASTANRPTQLQEKVGRKGKHAKSIFFIKRSSAHPETLEQTLLLDLISIRLQEEDAEYKNTCQNETTTEKPVLLAMNSDIVSKSSISSPL
jgi:hypothetical protein